MKYIVSILMHCSYVRNSIAGASGVNGASSIGTRSSGVIGALAWFVGAYGVVGASGALGLSGTFP